MKKNTYLCKTKLHAMHTAKANSITIEPPPLTGGAEAVYFFHSNHLGSASWITDGTGAAVQHLLYLPFGEHFVNEQSSGYFERFTFTGKERDAETGYYYHGARFNSSDIGWLSVDPQFDKLTSTTPYNYCLWNPIILHDPDGEIPVETIWDILNVAYDLGAAAYCKIQGDDAGANEHMEDAGWDLLAVAVPYVPAGANKVVRFLSKNFKKLDKVIVGGKSFTNLSDFYKRANKLSEGERIAQYREVGGQIAKKNGWEKNKTLSKKNGRDIYTDKKTGTHYSLDTRHGEFEVLDNKGKHQGSISFDGEMKKSADKK